MPTSDQIIDQWIGMINSDLEHTIRTTFAISSDDPTIYQAEGGFSMSLAQIQKQLQSGKFVYHYYSHGESLEIPKSDISAYTSIFSSTTDTSKALNSFLANAKKSSPRSNVAKYVLSQRLLVSPIASFKVPKTKSTSAHANPYFDVWEWSCHETGFLGPLDDEGYANPANAKMTHPMLPALYHHFGCLCPSWEALKLTQEVVKRQGLEGVVEVGSGNGYWTFLLRREGVNVVAIDNGDANWRTMWINDTVKMGGVEWLKQRDGSKTRALLMVYPVVGGDFTKSVLEAYEGNAILIGGTQNANRFTGFKNESLEDYFARERPDFQLQARIALPSFAGKDDAFFIFSKMNEP